jgi:uncharacterized protein (DUF362 family)/Pyruvate/2-oxoacid:ferredoxin oxidoreductase delta subunit
MAVNNNNNKDKKSITKTNNTKTNNNKNNKIKKTLNNTKTINNNNKKNICSNTNQEYNIKKNHNEVMVLKCSSYDSEELNKNIDIIFNKFLIGIIKKGNKVLLKTNMLMSSSENKAITTNSKIIEAVILKLKKIGAKPYVGDSPAIQSARYVSKISGVLDICKKHSVELIELNTPKQISIPNGKRIKSITVAKELDNFHHIINMPKLKTHSLAGLTLSIKNLYGVIPGKIKGYYHVKFQKKEDFSDLLLDLHEVIKPTFTIVDGIIGMEGEGPGSGTPRRLNIIVAGNNCHSIDRVISEVVGFKTKEVSTLVSARKRKIKEAELKNINIIGDDINSLKINNFKRPKGLSVAGILLKLTPNFISQIIRKIIIAKPFLIKEKCISCGNCKKICPNHAINFNKYPIFLYDKCIRCYCCHEVCPKKAIELKRKIF